MTQSVLIEQLEAIELSAYKLLYQGCSLARIIISGQLSDVDYVVTHTRHKLYAAVGQHIYLLYLVTPQVISHNYAGKVIDVSHGIATVYVTRCHYHVAGVL